MKEAEKILVFNNLQEQYLYLNLPIDQIDENSEFTIHNIQGVLSDLPYVSPVYRANFFSFVFVKDGTGKYTIDDQVFNTEPGTVYFTNPGHYKSHLWEHLNEVYLVTLSESFLKENVHPCSTRSTRMRICLTRKTRSACSRRWTRVSIP